MSRIIPLNGALLKMLRVLNPCIFRYPPTPYFVEGVAPRDSGGMSLSFTLALFNSVKVLWH